MDLDQVNTPRVRVTSDTPAADGASLYAPSATEVALAVDGTKVASFVKGSGGPSARTMHSGGVPVKDAGVAILTENAGALGGTNDGDLPDLTATYTALTSSPGGTADGAWENEGSLSTGDMYTDAAVNTVVDKLKNNIAELGTVVAQLAADNVALRAAVREVAAKVNASLRADGTDVTPAVTEEFVAEVNVPLPTLLTGIAIRNGSAVAGNVIVVLYNKAGTIVANSATAGTAQSGTEAFQRVPFTSTYQAAPGTYYMGVRFNNTGARLRAHPVGNFGTTKKTGQTFATLTALTAPTTFTANVGPMGGLY